MLTETEIAKLSVLLYPHPALRKKAALIAHFDPSLSALGRRLLALMREHEGVGLAAPQVGLPIRLFVANPTDDPANDRIYVNPALINLEGSERKEEGCLSIPEVNVAVERAAFATIRAYDTRGEPFEARSDGLLCRIWQHESDHLDGRLIIDYMDTQAELVNRKALKALKSKYEPSSRGSKRRR